MLSTAQLWKAGSPNEAHIAENFDIFDFELTDAEMQRIAAMDQNRRHASY